MVCGRGRSSIWPTSLTRCVAGGEFRTAYSSHMPYLVCVQGEELRTAYSSHMPYLVREELTYVLLSPVP